MSKAGLMLVSAIILTITASGCAAFRPAPEVRYVTRPLPLPAKPVLPRIKEWELSCLSDVTYHNLADRDRLRREYGEELAVIIQATHGDAR